jgi:hypothetical protein
MSLNRKGKKSPNILKCRGENGRPLVFAVQNETLMCEHQSLALVGGTRFGRHREEDRLAAESPDRRADRGLWKMFRQTRRAGGDGRRNQRRGLMRHKLWLFIQFGPGRATVEPVDVMWRFMTFGA